MGFVSHLKYPAADKNCVIVDILDRAGAVFYCKTNVPQTLFVRSQLRLPPGLAKHQTTARS